MATMADRIASGSWDHASTTEAKSVGLLLSLLSGLLESGTSIVLVLSVVGTLKDSLCAKPPSDMFGVNPLFLNDLGMS